jgi:glycolate oxidase
MDPSCRELNARFGSQRCLTSPSSLLAYECDAFTIHRCRPLAVVLPKTTEEVQEAVRILDRHNTPFLPRGAGTGLSGGATPSPASVIIDTALMKSVLHLDLEEMIAVVEPGLVISQLKSRSMGRITLPTRAANRYVPSGATWQKTAAGHTVSNTA